MTARFASRRMPRAFTLLEVMVALGILAVALVVLLEVQASSLLMAQQARALTVATQLARGKMYDCQEKLRKDGFPIGDFHQNGNFGDEGYEKFTWECHAYPFEMPASGAVDAASSPLTGMLGGAGGEGSQVDTSMAMGFLGPALSGVGDALKNAVREMVVVVRWEDDGVSDEIRVTTHMIDERAPAQIGNGVRAMTQQLGGGLGALGGLTGGAGGAGAPGLPGGTSGSSQGGQK